VRDYLEASLPQFVVGEYWDSLSYQFDGTPSHNQDPHRKRIVNWIEAAGGLATAFDITTKGILHAVFERCEYWRLSDAQGKPPGLMGWWPSRAVTFLENHDTGSTQGHWRFPHHALEQGYVYILTHPGTPTGERCAPAVGAVCASEGGGGGGGRRDAPDGRPNPASCRPLL
jgi:hypothetical protein